ncbi:MAG: flagellar export chaperone FliS [Pseudomonadota bacterium]|jgi:flagellar protein FliS|nr:flagellar export chaperone FliS [Rubrivivax sp.]
MFTPTAAARDPARIHPGALYRQVGVESQLKMASPHALVTMLFDGFMEALAMARGAMRDGRHDVKGEAIGRAVRIVEEGLRGGLDMQSGGSLARDLADLYSYLGLRLMQAQLRNDERLLEECQRLVQPLREAWASIAEHPAARIPR